MGGAKLKEFKGGVVVEGAWPCLLQVVQLQNSKNYFPPKHKSFKEALEDVETSRPDRLPHAHGAVTVWYPSAFGGDSPEIAPTFPRNLSLNLRTLLAENS